MTTTKGPEMPAPRTITTTLEVEVSIGEAELAELVTEDDFEHAGPDGAVAMVVSAWLAQHRALFNASVEVV